MDIDSCRVQRLIKARRDGKYYFMVGNREIRSIILPYHTRLDVCNKNNWLYDLIAPEPGHPAPNDIPMQHNQGGQTDNEYDEMELDAPTFYDTPTRAHTTVDPSNTFAGTFPRQQSQEEYDYVDIRTALDDVLCELQHCKDVVTECDQFLRDI